MSCLPYPLDQGSRPSAVKTLDAYWQTPVLYNRSVALTQLKTSDSWRSEFEFHYRQRLHVVDNVLTVNCESKKEARNGTLKIIIFGSSRLMNSTILNNFYRVLVEQRLGR